MEPAWPCGEGRYRSNCALDSGQVAGSSQGRWQDPPKAGDMFLLGNVAGFSQRRWQGSSPGRWQDFYKEVGRSHPKEGGEDPSKPGGRDYLQPRTDWQCSLLPLQMFKAPIEHYNTLWEAFHWALKKMGKKRIKQQNYLIPVSLNWPPGHKWKISCLLG